jgi:4-hydroxy-tetrahydrodipicolinate synthase
MNLLDQLMAAGVDPARVMPGTGCCALADTVRLTSHAVQHGCSGVLMLPPFYYKGVSVEGLYRSFAEVIERVADARTAIYLYHIPPVAQVGIPPELIDRLLTSYPGVIAGMKDSGGDWTYTRQVIEQFGNREFDIFVGSEAFLLANMRAGGAGAISATANVMPSRIADLYKTWHAGDADEQQAHLNAIRAIFSRQVMIPAMKRALAHWSNDEGWSRVRPPLVELDPAQSEQLISALQSAGFEMPGLQQSSAS